MVASDGAIRKTFRINTNHIALQERESDTDDVNYQNQRLDEVRVRMLSYLLDLSSRPS